MASVQVLTLEDLRSELAAFAGKELAELGRLVCETVHEELAGMVIGESFRPLNKASGCDGLEAETVSCGGIASSHSLLDIAPHQWTQRHLRQFHARVELRRIQSEFAVEEGHRNRGLSRASTSVEEVASTLRPLAFVKDGDTLSQTHPPQDHEPSFLSTSQQVSLSPRYSGSLKGSRPPPLSLSNTATGSLSDDVSMHSPPIRATLSRKNAWVSPMTQAAQEVNQFEMLPWQYRLESMVLDARFQYTILTFIVLSAIEVGAQADYMARHLERRVPLAFRVTGAFLSVVLSGEICIRLYIYRTLFFGMGGWAWNVFDLIVALAHLGESVLENFQGEQMNWIFLPCFIARLLCLIRLLRVVRYLLAKRNLGELRTLRTLIYCLVGSWRAFCWTVLVISLFVFMTSVFFTELVLNSRLDRPNDLDNTELSKWYGSVPRTFLSLYQALVGGVDWETVVSPLIDISPVLAVIFSLYIAVAVLAMLNVVTGIFVDTALTRAHRMKDNITVNNACRLFTLLDIDHSGQISEKEFESQLDSQPMQEYLAEIDVDVSEAKWLFEILDINSTGTIDFDEFLSGCVRLKGPAKALDLLLVTRESRRMFQQILAERKNVETQLGQIRSILGALPQSGR